MRQLSRPNNNRIAMVPAINANISLRTQPGANPAMAAPTPTPTTAGTVHARTTSAGLGIPITIAGTVGYMLAGLPQQGLMPPLSIGFVSLIGFAVMAPVSSFTAAYGARLAHTLPRRRLEIAFGIFLLVIATRFLASLIF